MNRNKIHRIAACSYGALSLAIGALEGYREYSSWVVIDRALSNGWYDKRAWNTYALNKGLRTGATHAILWPFVYVSRGIALIQEHREEKERVRRWEERNYQRKIQTSSVHTQ